MRLHEKIRFAGIVIFFSGVILCSTGLPARSFKFRDVFSLSESDWLSLSILTTGLVNPKGTLGLMAAGILISCFGGALWIASYFIKK